MKSICGIFVIICLLFSFTTVYAETLTLPNGQTLNIDNLTDTEISQAIKTARKSMGTNVETVAEIVKGVNPNDLDAWRKVITGTIKDVCNDLSISVNDFVKTPVGLGVAALIVYRVAGKDLLDNAVDMIVMIPLWFIMTGIILFLGWYCYSTKVYYNEISYDEKGRKVKKGLTRTTRYKWGPDPEKRGEMSNKTFFAIVLVVAEILGTVLTLVIVL